MQHALQGPAIGWVRGTVLAAMKGYTTDMQKKDKAAGLLREGVHFKMDKKKRLWWNYEAIDELIESGFEC